MTIARRVVDAAGALERYFRDAAAISPDFDSADSVSRAVMAGAAYHPKQLEEGVAAYAALVALQSPAFVDALSSYVDDPSERAAFADRLTDRPELVLDLPGAPEAAALASEALAGLGSDLVDRGRAVKQAAYTVQHQPWSLTPVAENAGRLSQVKARGQSRTSLDDAEVQRLISDVVARRNEAAAPSRAAPTPTVTRGLALAAAAVLGRAGEDRADALTPLLADQGTADCLKMAKLNLHQCLAVAGPQYEDVFCAGEHALINTGQCVVAAAGGTAWRQGVTVAVARTPARGVPAGVSVPLALRTAEPPAVGFEAQQAYAPRFPAAAGMTPVSAPPPASDDRLQDTERAGIRQRLGLTEGAAPR